jgi:hypothetical protein
MARAGGCELWSRSKSQRLGTIRVSVHTGSRWPRKARWYWFAKGRLARRGGPRIKSLWLTVRLAFWAKRGREILRLRLALWLLRSFRVSWVSRVAIGRRAVVRVLRVHRALLSRVVAGALVVGCVGAPIIAIDRLPHWWSTLHHVRRLSGHGRSTVRHPHLRLRSHRLRAAGHGRTGAEDVGEGGVPCSCGRAIGRARELPSWLVAVVRHVASSVRSEGRVYLCIRECCVVSEDFLSGVCCVLRGSEARVGRETNPATVSKGTAGLI